MKLKQKIQLKAQYIPRYEKWTKFFRYNKIFLDDQKIFYEEIDVEKKTYDWGIENVSE